MNDTPAHEHRYRAARARRHRLGVAVDSVCSTCGDPAIVVVSEDRAASILCGVKPRTAPGSRVYESR